MRMFDFQLYKPSEMELWINQKYIESGIKCTSDLDIEWIAEIFNVCIGTTQGKSKVLFDDEDCIILLANDQTEQERRRDFFHELSHPLLHCGDQHKLPKPLVHLQETQAEIFQLYASMPSYLIEAFRDSFNLISFPAILTEAFCLPGSIVRLRIDQMVRRINQERMDRLFRARFGPPRILTDYPQKISDTYDRSTHMTISLDGKETS